MKYISIGLLLIFSIFARAQRNEIYSNNIKTLQVVAGEDWLSPPVTSLKGGEPIKFSFDDLTHEYHRFVYKIEHCDADWTLSEDLFQSDYIDGFAEGNTIDNIEESINTNVLYTNYFFQIPNDKCSIKMSGNYKVTVYDENNNNEKILSACFMVVEPCINISLSATSNTDIDINKSHQQVSMQISYGNLSITDPQTQIKTVIMQNYRWDNAKINTKPQYFMSDGLKWEHNKDLIFDGGNEYHKFEVLDVDHTTMGLESVDWDGEDYNAYVWTDEPRLNYLYDEDANGAFYIRNSDNRENNKISEYVQVHFKLNAPRMNGDVYINGQWTNGQFSPSYKMEYDDIQKDYTSTIQLKQGYYSYQYLLMKPDGTTAPIPSEGNFYQTENSYQAFVYYKGIGERTDRLVGYKQLQLK